jgi:hypothetical protein
VADEASHAGGARSPERTLEPLLIVSLAVKSSSEVFMCSALRFSPQYVNHTPVYTYFV